MHAMIQDCVVAFWKKFQQPFNPAGFPKQGVCRVLDGNRNIPTYQHLQKLGYGLV